MYDGVGGQESDAFCASTTYARTSPHGEVVSKVHMQMILRYFFVEKDDHGDPEKALHVRRHMT